MQVQSLGGVSRLQASGVCGAIAVVCHPPQADASTATVVFAARLQSFVTFPAQRASQPLEYSPSKLRLGGLEPSSAERNELLLLRRL